MAERREAINEFSSAALALAERPPFWLARAVTITLCVAVLLLVAYASFAHMDVVVTANGRIVPSGRTLLVQAADGGVVRAVYARDGQRVRAGDLLLELAAGRGNGLAAAPATTSGAGTALLDTRLLETLSKLAALEADLTRRQSERESVTGVIGQLRLGLTLLEKKHAMREQLARSGHLTESALIESRMELLNLQKEMTVQQSRLQEAEAALAAAIQQKTQAEAEYKARFPAETVQVVRTAGTHGRQGAVRAPADGVVHWLSAPAAGTPVSAGQNLLVVVPENAALEIEMMVQNRDIGHLRDGQRAVIKVETFDYTRYGHIEGAVQWIGADAITDPKIGPVYAARTTLAAAETPNGVNGARGRLAPGMNVTVDVRVAERRMIEYFLAPLLRYKEESLRER